jgi:hypothetical protein
MNYIYIKTQFPFKLDYKCSFNNNQLSFITNDTKKNAGKITVSEATYFMNKLIEDNKDLINNLFVKYPNINNKNMRFIDCFVCLEDFRNMSYGFIDSLIKDITSYSNNKIGDFGYLCGDTKPLRLKFIELSKTHKMLEYYSTPKYNPKDPSMITFNDMKKYKYLIDIPGHGYSTKIYSYLHCKRVVFRVKKRKRPFYWEKYLIPNVHYIEVNNDFSDLIEKYEYLEKHPDIYNQIVKNCDELVTNQINQQNLKCNFLNILFHY